MLPGIKGSGKTNITSSNTAGLITTWFTNNCQIYDQIKFHMVKGIDNAFDHMELCFVL